MEELVAAKAAKVLDDRRNFISGSALDHSHCNKDHYQRSNRLAVYRVSEILNLPFLLELLRNANIFLGILLKNAKTYFNILCAEACMQ